MNEKDIVEIMEEFIWKPYVRGQALENVLKIDNIRNCAKAIMEKADWCKHHSHDVNEFYEPKEEVEINETLNGRTIFKD